MTRNISKYLFEWGFEDAENPKSFEFCWEVYIYRRIRNNDTWPIRISSNRKYDGWSRIACSLSRWDTPRTISEMIYDDWSGFSRVCHLARSDDEYHLYTFTKTRWYICRIFPHDFYTLDESIYLFSICYRRRDTSSLTCRKYIHLSIDIYLSILHRRSR